MKVHVNRFALFLGTRKLQGKGDAACSLPPGGDSHGHTCVLASGGSSASGAWFLGSAATARPFRWNFAVGEMHVRNQSFFSPQG